LSCFLDGISFWPIFSSSANHAGLVVLDPGAAFILSVIESLAVEAQILVFATRHCLCFCVSLVSLSHPSVCLKRDLCSMSSSLSIFGQMCKMA
jgi:hypothetical protein